MILSETGGCHEAAARVAQPLPGDRFVHVSGRSPRVMCLVHEIVLTEMRGSSDGKTGSLGWKSVNDKPFWRP